MGQARNKMLRRQAELAKMSPVMRALVKHYRPDGTMIDHQDIDAAWRAHKKAA